MRARCARFGGRRKGCGVTDDQSWTAPGASPSAAPAVAAAAGTGWQHQPAPAAWAPPPKPGLIPLHPLSFGTILGSSFRVMRRNPGPTFGLSLLLYGFVAIAYAVILGGFFAFATDRVSSASNDDQADIMAGAAGLLMLLSLIPIGLSIAAAGIVQGILSLEVSRATLGEKLKLRGLWRLARGRIGTLVLWALLTTTVLVAFVAVVFAATVAVTFVFAMSAVAGSDSFSPSSTAVATLVSIFVMFGAGLIVVALSVWLGIKTSLVPSIIVLERLGLFAAIARSWRLTRGHFWRTFGIQILIGVVVNVAASIVTFPLQIISSFLVALINPLGDSTGIIIGSVALAILVILLSVVIGAIGLVMQSSSLALIYVDIRMRNEGLDLELLHYVEAKRSETPGVENPYLRLQQGLPAAAPLVRPATGSPWA